MLGKHVFLLYTCNYMYFIAML